MPYDFEALDSQKARKGRIAIAPEEKTGERKAAISKVADSILSEIEKNGTLSKAALERIKNAAASKHKLANVIKSAELFSELEQRGAVIDGELAALLRVKSVRALSGITNIALMTRPLESCPFDCIYCPQGSDAPRSYTGYEPSARRARQNDFDPARQVGARLEQLRINGHPASKCEVIVQGGTFNRQRTEYQESFISGILEALNGKKSETLESALIANEEAKHRMIGLTVETRPDCASKKEVNELVKLGTTRIELGVQTLSDEKYKLARRGHGRKEVVEATRNCKDALLKVCYHMMPGLFSTIEEDEKYFDELFANPDFRPDMLKIYPTLVMPGTGLYALWKKGEFTPPSEEDILELLVRIKKKMPKYVRIMRVERDIPSNLIGEGIKTLNIRQVARAQMQKHGEKCNCIRCREVGFRMLHEKITPDFSAVELDRADYAASGGKEIFLSVVDRTNDALMGICRMRVPSKGSFVEEIGGNCGIRELHVYGDELELSHRQTGAAQHRGYGKTLLAEAERIAKEEFGSKKLPIISGAGVRPYYFKLGYERDGPYVNKNL